jgi:hemerythrin-like domain-containing protein
MKGIFQVAGPVETRRKFIGRGGLLMAAAFALPSGWSAEEDLKSVVQTIRQKKGALEISPVEDLMREHGVLARILLIYEEIISRLSGGIEFPSEVLAESAGLIHRFVEDYHEKLEEKSIFPRFVKAGRLVDLVRILLEQHQAGRVLTDRIKALADSSLLRNSDQRKQVTQYLQLFIRMYRPHKAREDTVLFPAIHVVIPPEEFDAIGEAFEDQEEELFGKGGFEKIVAEVADHEKAVGIHELAQFTPKV